MNRCSAARARVIESLHHRKKRVNRCTATKEGETMSCKRIWGGGDKERKKTTTKKERERERESASEAETQGINKKKAIVLDRVR